MGKRGLVAGAAIVAVLGGVVGFVALRHHGTKTGASDDPAGALHGGDGVRGSGGGDAQGDDATIEGVVIDLTSGGRVTKDAVVAANESWKKGGSPLSRMLPKKGARTRTTPAVTRVDDRGRFRLSVPPGKYVISASATGRLPATREIELAAGEQRDLGTLALASGGVALSGTVTDVGGGPIPGALISASGSADGGEDGALHGAAYTNDDGAYTLTLAPASYGLSIWHPDYVPVSDGVALRDTPVTRSFVLTPGGVIEGRVVTRAGDPVPGAKLSARGGHATGGASMRADLGPGAEADADDAGHFSLRGLGSGLIRISAVAPGWSSNEPATVELGVGESVSDVQVVLDRAYSISGRVFEEGKETAGIGDVNVMAVVFSANSGMPNHDTTNADGSFRIDGLRSGTYAMMAMGDGVVPSFLSVSATVSGADVKDVKLPVARGVSLRGKIDPPGVAHVGLELQRDEDNMGPGDMKGMMAANSAGADTGADGAFELKAIPPGKYRIVASAKDGAAGKLAVDVAASQEDGLVVSMSARATVDGIVVDGKGAPVPDARVALTRSLPGGRQPSMRFMMEDGMGGANTDADGKFHIVGVDPGTYTVGASDRSGKLAPSGDKPVQIDVVAAAAVRDVRVVVDLPDGVIRGVVKRKDGAPVADAWVTATKASTGDRFADMESSWSFDTHPVLTDQSGRFTFDKLHKGKYDLTADGMRGSRRGAVKDVEPGADVTIEIRALAGVSGVVSLNGAPVTEYDLSIRAKEQAGVYVSSGGGFDRAKHVSAADGRYHVDRLEAGEYVVSVKADAGSAHATVKIEPETEATLDLPLSSFGAVKGQVVDVRTKAPIVGAAVIAVTDGAEMDMDFSALFGGKGPRTDGEGRFTIDRLSAGDGNVMVIGDDFHPVTSRRYALAAGATVDLGVLEGVPPKKPGDDKPGELGARFEVASWTKRPGAVAGESLPPGVDDHDEFLWVESVDGGSPAANAGLAVGDRVLAMDDLTVAAVGGWAVEDAIERMPAGQIVKLQIDRKGAKSELAITVGAAAAPP